MEAKGIRVRFEMFRISYEVPASAHHYTPDFELPNGIIIETKGIFETTDRAKHILIKSQHPGLDIRFVFSNSNAKIYKGSPTTYGDWCEAHGFRYSDKVIPAEWLKEAGPKQSAKQLLGRAYTLTARGSK